MSEEEIDIFTLAERQAKKYPKLYVEAMKRYDEGTDYCDSPLSSSPCKAIKILDFYGPDTPINILKKYKELTHYIRESPSCSYLGSTMNYTYGCKKSGTSQQREKLTRLLNLTVDILAICKEVQPTLFQNSNEMQVLNDILYNVITVFGRYNMEPSSYIKDFVNKVNGALGEERVIINCNENSNDIDYTCGRAVSYIPCEANLEDPGYILVYNTTSKDSDYQSFSTLEKQWKFINETKCKPSSSSSSTNGPSAAGSGALGGKRRTHRRSKKKANKSRRWRK